MAGNTSSERILDGPRHPSPAPGKRSPPRAQSTFGIALHCIHQGRRRSSTTAKESCPRSSWGKCRRSNSGKCRNIAPRDDCCTAAVAAERLVSSPERLPSTCASACWLMIEGLLVFRMGRKLRTGSPEVNTPRSRLRLRDGSPLSKMSAVFFPRRCQPGNPHQVPISTFPICRSFLPMLNRHQGCPARCPDRKLASFAD